MCKLSEVVLPLWNRCPELKPKGMLHWYGCWLEWSLGDKYIAESCAASLCCAHMQEWSGLVREDQPYFGLSLCQQNGKRRWNAMIGHTGLSRAAPTIVEASAEACAYILDQLKPQKCPTCGRNPPMPTKTTMPLVKDSSPYRTINIRTNSVPYPEHWPPYHNDYSNPCDMLQGPCVCGAWHQLDEWEVVTYPETPNANQKTN